MRGPDVNDLVRITFLLDSALWHGSATERLWAERIGNSRYRLRNSPFFAFGVSAEDIVFGDETDSQIIFKAVSIRGGHSTYRLMIATKRENAAFAKHWEPLQRLGCSYEEGRVLAVDVPPAADVYAVYKLLEEGEAAGVWEFEEGHCGHSLRPNAGTE